MRHETLEIINYNYFVSVLEQREMKELDVKMKKKRVEQNEEEERIRTSTEWNEGDAERHSKCKVFMDYAVWL